MPLKALALNCSLKPKQQESSTEKLLREVLESLSSYGVEADMLRIVDFNIKPGVTSDEGEGDDWPGIRANVIGCDILVFGTPIWLGQPSSVAKRVLERMDAFLGETDENGRMPSFSKIAVIVIVGNEDGAHHVTAELCQALMEVGFTIPANGATYWVGEAMGKIDYKDLPKVPAKVAQTTAMLAANAVHLARLLKASPYPGTRDMS